MKKSIVIIVLFTILLTACASAQAKPNTDTQTTDEAVKLATFVDNARTVSEASSQEKAIDTTGAVIVFQRSGGFAGVAEQWLIYADGKISPDKGDKRTVNADQVTTLLGNIKASGFFEMQDSFAGGKFSSCKDCFTYQITVTSEGITKTVTATDGASGVPDGFWKIVDQINGLLNSQ